MAIDSEGYCHLCGYKSSTPLEDKIAALTSRLAESERRLTVADEVSANRNAEIDRLEAELEKERIGTFERRCCASCHFGCDGDGETVFCNWTGEERKPKDSVCESYDGEHPDSAYYRIEADDLRVKLAAAVARAERAEAEVLRLRGRTLEGFVIARMQEMADQSLSPELHDAFVSVRDALITTRRDLGRLQDVPEMDFGNTQKR
jgi:hypothetical protein